MQMITQHIGVPPCPSQTPHPLRSLARVLWEPLPWFSQLYHLLRTLKGPGRVVFGKKESEAEPAITPGGWPGSWLSTESGKGWRNGTFWTNRKIWRKWEKLEKEKKLGKQERLEEEVFSPALLFPVPLREPPGIGPPKTSDPALVDFCGRSGYDKTDSPMDVKRALPRNVGEIVG